MINVGGEQMAACILKKVWLPNPPCRC